MNVLISVLNGRDAIDKAAICLGRTALDKGSLPRPRRVFANADLGSIIDMSVDNLTLPSLHARSSSK
jgi:hypothetical protein